MTGVRNRENESLTQTKVVVGFDCNETFAFDDEDQAASTTARGQTILMWFLRHHLRLPKQQGDTPSCFPYNPAQQT